MRETPGSSFLSGTDRHEKTDIVLLSDVYRALESHTCIKQFPISANADIGNLDWRPRVFEFSRFGKLPVNKIPL